MTLPTPLSDAERAKPAFQAARAAWDALAAEFETSAARARQGGGQRAAERQRARGRLPVRERLALLLDDGVPFDELMLHAGWGMYEEQGGAPAGGVVAGVGRIAGREWMVIANDATVKAGAFYPITAKKVIRAQTIALENRLPVAYLVDSAGVYLPMQDEIFPDQDDFGRVFYLNARLSALGVPQVAAIMGNCVAGGAYLPVMCDTLIMTDGSGLYLAGPALVKAAIGQVVDGEDLGGAAMHASVAGTVDYREPDDERALARLRYLAAIYARGDLAPWARRRAPSVAPAADPADLTGIVSPDGSRPYDTREVIARLVDGGSFAEFKGEYGQTMLTGFARLGGYPVGIVANQRSVVRKRDRIEVGGVIYAEAADKAARFVLDANQAGVPLVFLSDVTGFMVGRDSEHQGIIRRGAKLVNAVSNSVVPKLTLITGGSYGAGNYAMAGKAYAPRFIYAWPSAKYAVMSGNAAAKTLLDIQVQQLERRGETVTDETLRALYDEVKAKYDTELDARYAASRLWVDEILHPLESRERLVRSLDACANNPHQEELRLGVFQV